MRVFILAATLASFALPLAPALADPPRWSQSDQQNNSDAQHGDHQSRDQQQDRRNQPRDYGQHDYGRYNYNNPDPRYGDYQPERYYSDGSQYQTRQIQSNDRIYRGRDNRYYCRRNDGTTGLIVGGLGGGVLGNLIAPGGSKTLGTILGGGAGALLGRSIDRRGGNSGAARCR